MAAVRKSNPRSSTKTRANARTATRSRSASAEPLLDERAQRDITGVGISVVGVALTIALFTHSDAAVTSAAANALRLAFGAWGAPLIPIALLMWGVSFFVRIDIREGRTGAGLGLVLLSLIAFAAVAPKGAVSVSRDAVLAEGGFVGNYLALGLTKLLGQPVTVVLLVGAFLVGLVVTGLSISDLVDWLSARFSRDREELPPRVKPTKRARSLAQFEDSAGETAALPERRTRKPSKKDARSDEPTAAVPATTVVGPRALEGFELPPLTLLSKTTASASDQRATENELREVAEIITDTLLNFDIAARVVEWVVGPTITQFQLEIAKGVKLSRVTALSDDLALALAAATVRIEAPIPGKSLIGIEVPNKMRSTVTLGDVLAPAGTGGPLLLGIGKDVTGEGVLADLAAMPHLLIGGTTGSGKSVAINAMLLSILMRATPSEVRLILIDPKRVELSAYNGVPHLYVPVVTEPKEAASALAWAVSEMERRLKVLQAAGAKNIGLYNAMIQEGRGPEGAPEMPYLCIVIDELADLMMVAAKEVEDSICRIAQLARAAGIHLVVATQRPEANVVTGLIKANITNRIAFNVASTIDSRVVLDQPGAEKLLGDGDMLFSRPAWDKPKRIQGCWVTEAELEAIVEQLKSQGEPEYHEEILHLKVAAAGGGVDTGEDDDPMLWDAADIVVTSGLGSTSLLQRRLKVGYARAGRIMDMLQAKGIVGPPDGSKPREVLADVEDLESIKSFDRIDGGDDY